MVRKRTNRKRLREATPGRCVGRAMSVTYWRCSSGPDCGTNVLSLAQVVRRYGDGSIQGVEAGSEGERKTSQGGFRPYTG